MSEYKACKDCKHFYPPANCLRIREKTVFNPIDGVMTAPTGVYDVFDERDDNLIHGCGVGARFFEAIDK